MIADILLIICSGLFCSSSFVILAARLVRRYSPQSILHDHLFYSQLIISLIVIPLVLIGLILTGLFLFH